MFMDRLSPADREIVLDRFHQSPVEWPAGMRDEVDFIATIREPRCSEDVIEVIAEYVTRFVNPIEE